MTFRRIAALLAAWFILGLASHAAAQVAIEPRIRPPAQPAAETPANLRVDTSMVLVPAHVNTELGAAVTDLGKNNFRIFEDDVEQPVTYFAKEDTPVSVGVLFDSSASMHNKIQKSSEAAATFFKTANAQDEFFLVAFDERPRLAVGFTPDSGELYKRIAHTRPFGRTSLLDAIHMALQQMKNARNARKALVIVSDGGDNRSRHTLHQVRDAVLESDVQVYAMGIFDPAEARKTREEEGGPRLLEELAEQSGGHHYPVENLSDLPEISARIGNELRDQYLLGYSPSNPDRDGKYRRIKVKLDLADDDSRRGLRVHYRLGYYAPSN